MSAPRLAGVVNVTPDSFSDGGEYAESQRAIDQGLRLWEEGAAHIDVGGESTRPGADPVPPKQELARILPVIQGLHEAGVTVSVDTRRAGVARLALQAGASVVNDVSGLRDPEMLQVVSEAGAGLVIMHMRGLPKTMQRDTHYRDLMSELRSFLHQALEQAKAEGVDTVWLDPGIGFGKSAAQCAEILRRLSELHVLGAPLYVGASRKSFIGVLSGESDPRQRLPGSLAAAAAAWRAGADILRVHDVAATRQFLTMLEHCSPDLVDHA